MQITSEIEARFWAKVKKGENCWIWQGASSGNNRGSFQINSRRYVPTEVALALSGQFRKGSLMILHDCDNKMCVNPKHLYWGTQSRNMQDRTERHIGWAVKGPTRCRGGRHAFV